MTNEHTIPDSEPQADAGEDTSLEPTQVERVDGPEEPATRTTSRQRNKVDIQACDGQEEPLTGTNTTDPTLPIHHQPGSSGDGESPGDPGDGPQEVDQHVHLKRGLTVSGPLTVTSADGKQRISMQADSAMAGIWVDCGRSSVAIYNDVAQGPVIGIYGDTRKPWMQLALGVGGQGGNSPTLQIATQKGATFQLCLAALLDKVDPGWRDKVVTPEPVPEVVTGTEEPPKFEPPKFEPPKLEV